MRAALAPDDVVKCWVFTDCKRGFQLENPSERQKKLEDKARVWMGISLACGVVAVGIALGFCFQG